MNTSNLRLRISTSRFMSYCLCLIMCAVIIMMNQHGELNRQLAWLVLGFGILSVIKSRKNWYLLIIEIILLFCNWSIVGPNYLFSIRTSFTELATDSAGILGLNILLIFSLFNYIFSPIVKNKNEEKPIVTPSQWLADKVKLSFLRAKDTHVIHNGIDTDIFKQNSDKKKLKQELRLPENKKIVLSVAVDIMSERKGGKHVVKLAELMKNDDTYFVLIGDN